MKNSLLRKMGLHRKELVAWALYDWANSAFATTVMVAILPIYFADVAAKDLAPAMRSSVWGYGSAFSLMVVAVLTPLFGVLADIIPRKKFLLMLCTLLGSISCLGLYFVGEGDWMLAVCLFVLATMGFSAGNTFYEALLPYIASEDELDSVSTGGYAIGYLGGGVLLALNLVMIQKYEWFMIPNKTEAVKISLASAGAWWILFSLPLFFFVKEPAVANPIKIDLWSAVKQSGTQLQRTFNNLRSYRYVFLFLLSYWLYSDGIGTVMKMATIYGKEIGIESGHLIGAMLLVQFLGIPCTFAFGPFAERYGAKLGIQICLCVYMFVCVFGFYMTTALHFWILAIAVALVQGGCQALSRSLFATIVPRKQTTEFFGFFSVSSKFAGIFGPLVFGVFANLFGQSRFSILFLVAFFIWGMILLHKLDLKKARAAAKLF